MNRRQRNPKPSIDARLPVATLAILALLSAGSAQAAIDLVCDYEVERIMISPNGNFLPWLRLERSVLVSQGGVADTTHQGKKQFFFWCVSDAREHNPNSPRRVGVDTCQNYLNLLTVAKAEGTRVRVELDTTKLVRAGEPHPAIELCGEIINWTSIEEALGKVHIYNEPPNL